MRDIPTVRERGTGPPILLIHGSAADGATWTFQLATLAKSHRLIAYDRRPGVTTVAEHAGDAIHILDRAGIDVAHVCGSSFGAVVALELARRVPERVAAAVLCEPPMACGDRTPALPAGFGCLFDRVVVEQGGRAAGELFLRLVLSERAYASMSPAFRDAASSRFEQIRQDSLALCRYRPRYEQLCDLQVPMLLLAGERSSPRFADTLDRLELHLPRVWRRTLAGAGHMMHAEAPHDFNRVVAEMVAAHPIAPPSTVG